MDHSSNLPAIFRPEFQPETKRNSGFPAGPYRGPETENSATRKKLAQRSEAQLPPQPCTLRNRPMITAVPATDAGNPQEGRIHRHANSFASQKPFACLTDMNRTARQSRMATPSTAEEDAIDEPTAGCLIIGFGLLLALASIISAFAWGFHCTQ